jgi:hypothetical protein
METATAVRWRKYGKDRLYVNAAGGKRIGWRDLVTGQDHVEDEDCAELFSMTVAAWLANLQHDSMPVGGHSVDRGPTTHQDLGRLADASHLPVEGEPPISATPVSGPSVDTDGPPHLTEREVKSDEWEDLADRRAGAAAREQAVKLKHERPILTRVARVLGVHTDERAWRTGADGEEKVAARLAKLAKADPRWHFLHAIPVGERGSDIDHVVIGPGGVFTLNAKNHPNAKLWIAGDTFLVNGQRHPYIRNSRFEAFRAAGLLSSAAGIKVDATGVVVPVGAAGVVIKKAPHDVVVVNRMRLVKWLTSQPEILVPEVVGTIFEAARRSTTWHHQGNP